MEPYQGGGDMIRSVSFEKTTYNDLPHKFEAGTPNIVGPIGLAALRADAATFTYGTGLVGLRLSDDRSGPAAPSTIALDQRCEVV